MNCSYQHCHNKNSLAATHTISCLYCKTVYYCCENCRNADWDINHKQVCNIMSASNISYLSNDQSSLDISNMSNVSTLKKSKKTLQDYEILNASKNKSGDLGKGSYGAVKLAKEKGDPNNTLYALKIVNKKILLEYASSEILKREVKIHKKLDHPHVIKLYHFFEDVDNVYLLLEYAENGNLYTYLRKKKKISEKEAFIYFFQTCLGIDYLHKKKILHRDLKPENLLLDKFGNIKLCDFGWSTEDSGKRNTFCGTADYMAPEMIQNQPHDYKIDIWSLGILLYELLHGMPPFKGKNNEEKFGKILKNEIMFYDVSIEAQNLICLLLKPNPTERPTFDVIFSHPWLKIHEKEFKIKINDYIYKAPKRSLKKHNSDLTQDTKHDNLPLTTSSSSSIKLKKQNTTPLSNESITESQAEYSLDESIKANLHYSEEKKHYANASITPEKMDIEATLVETHDNLIVLPIEKCKKGSDKENNKKKDKKKEKSVSNSLSSVFNVSAATNITTVSNIANGDGGGGGGISDAIRARQGDDDIVQDAGKLNIQPQIKSSKKNSSNDHHQEHQQHQKADTMIITDHTKLPNNENIDDMQNTQKLANLSSPSKLKADRVGVDVSATIGGGLGFDTGIGFKDLSNLLVTQSFTLDDPSLSSSQISHLLRHLPIIESTINKSKSSPAYTKPTPSSDLIQQIMMTIIDNQNSDNLPTTTTTPVTTGTTATTNTTTITTTTTATATTTSPEKATPEHTNNDLPHIETYMFESFSQPIPMNMIPTPTPAPLLSLISNNSKEENGEYRTSNNSNNNGIDVRPDIIDMSSVAKAARIDVDMSANWKMSPSNGMIKTTANANANTNVMAMARVTSPRKGESSEGQALISLVNQTNEIANDRLVKPASSNLQNAMEFEDKNQIKDDNMEKKQGINHQIKFKNPIGNNKVSGHHNNTKSEINLTTTSRLSTNYLADLRQTNLDKYLTNSTSEEILLLNRLEALQSNSRDIECYQQQQRYNDNEDKYYEQMYYGGIVMDKFDDLMNSRIEIVDNLQSMQYHASQGMFIEKNVDSKTGELLTNEDCLMDDYHSKDISKGHKNKEFVPFNVKRINTQSKELDQPHNTSHQKSALSAHIIKPSQGECSPLKKHNYSDGGKLSKLKQRLIEKVDARESEESNRAKIVDSFTIDKNLNNKSPRFPNVFMDIMNNPFRSFTNNITIISQEENQSMLMDKEPYEHEYEYNNNLSNQRGFSFGEKLGKTGSSKIIYVKDESSKRPSIIEETDNSFILPEKPNNNTKYEKMSPISIESPFSPPSNSKKIKNSCRSDFSSAFHDNENNENSPFISNDEDALIERNKNLNPGPNDANDHDGGLRLTKRKMNGNFIEEKKSPCGYQHDISDIMQPNYPQVLSINDFPMNNKPERHQGKTRSRIKSYANENISHNQLDLLETKTNNIKSKDSSRLNSPDFPEQQQVIIPNPKSQKSNRRIKSTNEEMLLLDNNYTGVDKLGLDKGNLMHAKSKSNITTRTPVKKKNGKSDDHQNYVKNDYKRHLVEIDENTFSTNPEQVINAKLTSPKTVINSIMPSSAASPKTTIINDSNNISGKENGKKRKKYRHRGEVHNNDEDNHHNDGCDLKGFENLEKMSDYFDFECAELKRPSATKHKSNLSRKDIPRPNNMAARTTATIMSSATKHKPLDDENLLNEDTKLSQVSLRSRPNKLIIDDQKQHNSIAVEHSSSGSSFFGKLFNAFGCISREQQQYQSKANQSLNESIKMSSKLLKRSNQSIIFY